MHWMSGTWLWAKHRASRSLDHTTTININIHPDLDQDALFRHSTNSTSTPHTRTRAWSLQSSAPSTSTSASASATTTRTRSTSNTSAFSTSTTSHVRPSSHLHRTLSHPHRPEITPQLHLRCARCNGYRSRGYHQRHFQDPAMYPSIGICSRAKTGCLGFKADAECGVDTVLRDGSGNGEEDVDKEMEFRRVFEMPDTSGGRRFSLRSMDENLKF
ncbi:hypothetical protein BJY04DRAFT_219992 [Aspergillus karnatakaensis]|uniref:uncharacterized protein n=1 Tax=Aspergillus karnatakaensis TaxID=1810916 RepID=UPI003CCE2E8C